jgi:hypothetical protein
VEGVAAAEDDVGAAPAAEEEDIGGAAAAAYATSCTGNAIVLHIDFDFDRRSHRDAFLRMQSLFLFKRRLLFPHDGEVEHEDDDDVHDDDDEVQQDDEEEEDVDLVSSLQRSIRSKLGLHFLDRRLVYRGFLGSHDRRRFFIDLERAIYSTINTKPL